MLSKWNVTNFRIVDTPYLAAKLTIPGFGFESIDRHGMNLTRMYNYNILVV